MPKRQLKLTWQKGTTGRAGRWRKMIDGQMFYFDGGSGKSDRRAYQTAVEDCARIKAEIAATAEKPHAAEYLEAILEWEAVKAFCESSGEELLLLEEASAKIKELRKRLDGPRPRALAQDDQFFERYELQRERIRKIVAEIDLKIQPPTEVDLDQLRKSLTQSNKRRPKTTSNSAPSQQQTPRLELELSQWDREEMIWRDRIKSATRRKPAVEDTLAGNIEQYLKFQKDKIGKGTKQISVGRWANIKRDLDAFRDEVGGSIAVKSIEEEVLRRYYASVHKRVSSNGLSSSTGRDRASTVGQFIRWLWKEGRIPALPRNLGDHLLSPEANEIKVFSVEQIHQILNEANERLRTFILLGLNCGMTQKDISDLRPSEVDLNRGTISRKRSKTIRLKSTPTVTFKIWPETIALMKRNRSKNKEHYFTNNLGNPLKSESVGEGNKFSKTDIIGKDFRTLRDVLKIDQDLSFINLKKTSRSLLEDNKLYQPIAELFVGRRPRSVSERHYAKPPETWLAEATDWLRGELKIEKVLK